MAHSLCPAPPHLRLVSFPRGRRLPQICVLPYLRLALPDRGVTNNPSRHLVKSLPLSCHGLFHLLVGATLSTLPYLLSPPPLLIVCSTTWLTTVLLSYCVSGIHCILVEYHDSVPSYPICPQSHPCLTDCTAVLMIRPKSCPVYYSVYPFLTQCSAACLTISVLSCHVLLLLVTSP